ncbi:MAG: hypothetical protein HY848_15680 [Betaproteobacteria bacterium]|nr:hypothetical protein [Betaproteobacteria bacterium]
MTVPNPNITGGEVQKKIAVLVRERQSEALRMSLGLILVDDLVDVYVLDRKLQATGETALHLETLKEMDIQVRTNCRENEGMEYLPVDEIALSLPRYDHILAY